MYQIYLTRKIHKTISNRLAFIEDYTLKSLRLKPEKWNKLVISDDQRGFLHSFVDQGRNNASDIITPDFPGFDPNKITFDMRIIWSRKQGGRVEEGDKLSANFIIVRI